MRIGRIPKTRVVQQPVNAQHLSSGPPRAIPRSLGSGRSSGMYRPFRDASYRTDATRYATLLSFATGHRERARRRFHSRYDQRIAGTDSSRCYPTFGQDPVVTSTFRPSAFRWRTASTCTTTATARRTRATRFGT